LLGAEGNLLEPKPENYRKIRLQSPIVSTSDMRRLLDQHHSDWKVRTVSTLFPADDGLSGMTQALDRLMQAVDRYVEDGCSLLVLSDRGVSKHQCAIPSLLAVSAVHHHLIRSRRRN